MPGSCRDSEISALLFGFDGATLLVELVDLGFEPLHGSRVIHLLFFSRELLAQAGEFLFDDVDLLFLFLVECHFSLVCQTVEVGRLMFGDRNREVSGELKPKPVGSGMP